MAGALEAGARTSRPLGDERCSGRVGLRPVAGCRRDRSEEPADGALGQGDEGCAWPPACFPQEQVEGVDQAAQRGSEQPEREGGADLAQHAGREGLVHRVVQEKWKKNEENGDDNREECQFDRILPTPHVQEQGVIATQTDEINCDSFLYFFCTKEIYIESK